MKTSIVHRRRGGFHKSVISKVKETGTDPENVTGQDVGVCKNLKKKF